MAEDSLGQRKEVKAPWTKIFTAFKVALDFKKLVLAAAGILVMSLGWWFLGWFFFTTRSLPQPADYLANAKTETEKEEKWKDFQMARARWNLLYEMAGPSPVSIAEAKRYDAGDVAATYQQYEEIKAIEAARDPGAAGDKKKDAKSLDEIRKDILARDGDKKEAGLAALKRYEESLSPGKIKAHSRLRTLPWFEERGYNPYLLVTENIKQASSEGVRTLPWARGEFLGWLVSNQLPVLIEPLIKMLAPIAYFFDSRAGGWNRLYLISVILWTLAVWGFFGGAITRMAAVQVARNEKISIMEAVRFAKQRLQSFFSAPVFPLIFLGVLTFFLIIFGLFSGLIPILGDVLIAGLMWPLVIVIGLIMAVVLVGLVGWPLMNATISAEGSDSFDALSRSYSYVYQAPWQYMWYSAVALVYGAVLVFFVGLMGSLMVYLGQWGVSQAPFLSSAKAESDREPTYLFVNAPTSFGWRDLLLHSSPFAKEEAVVSTNGSIVKAYELNKDYMNSMKPWNYLGAFLVSVWLYALFLLIVGFGYSYFWTASTIIYLLMRHQVDDTDLDEIHLEEDEQEDTFAKDLTPAAAAAPKPAPSAAAVTMVEAPTLRPSTPPSPPSPPPVAITPAAVVTTPAPATANDNKPSGEGPAPAAG